MDLETAGKTQASSYSAKLAAKFVPVQIATSTWYIDSSHTLRSLDRVAKWFRLSISMDSEARILIFNHAGVDTRAILSLLNEELSQNYDFNLTHVIFCADALFVESSGGSSPTGTEDGQACAPRNGEHLQHRQAAIWRSFPGVRGEETILTFPTIRDAVEYVRLECLNKGKIVQCLAAGSSSLATGVRQVLMCLERDPAAPILESPEWRTQ